jgi:hypothetical protein
MKRLLKQKRALVLVFGSLFCAAVHASNLDTIGVTLLRMVTTNVDGSGIRVAQPEAGYDQVTNWEVNPGAVSRPIGFLTYISTNGSTTVFPNSLSSESSHADHVGNNFYGMPNGVATNVVHADNYDADYFYNSIVDPTPYFLSNINDPIVNQSFTFGSLAASDQETVDSAYDNYAVEFKTLFVSAVDNGGNVHAPGTSYNCIGVGVSDGSSSYGPTIDNGRCKPDIIAPDGTTNGATSFSTPYVAGAAAVLMQAALRGDGGSDTNSAADMRMIKAFLLNGAIKPADWTNNSPSPLDTRYGAGVLNIFNSYEQLADGKHGYIVSTTVSTGDAHPPTGAAGTIGVLSGWDFNTNTSSSGNDAVNHYFFNVTNGVNNATFTATITLAWNRPQSLSPQIHSGINNLDLFLYNAANSNLVAASTSVVDNVQHIFIPKLAQGRYDLQVLKNAGNSVSDSETYALAFEFFSTSLSIVRTNSQTMVSWSIYPDGFALQSATNLISPIIWNTNSPAPVVMNNQNVIFLNTTNANQFFRLWRP